MQAQTPRRRFDEADRLWLALDELIHGAKLPARVADPLFDAVLGGLRPPPDLRKARRA